MTKKVAIFGGGITGLTIAHELINNGFDIDLYELNNIVGGMARSKRDTLYVPNEHSFRTITNTYHNTIDILKQIPLINNINSNVYNNLLFGYYQFRFFNYDNKTAPYLSYSDTIYLIYLYLNVNSSNKRKHIYYNKKIEPLLKKKLSKNGYDYAIKLMGIFGPMNINLASIGNFFDNIDISRHKYSYLTQNDTTRFYSSFFNQPTSEAWFDHWVVYLLNKGVNIYYNTKLTKINKSNNTIISCEVNNKPIIADYYIVSTSPYHTEQIFINSNLTKLANPYTNLNVTHNQISFHIGFDIKLHVNKFDSIFVLFDSPYGIMICQQDSLWHNCNNNIKLDKKKQIKSLWSGICTDSITKGVLFNKPLTLNDKSQLYNEILFQLFKSDDFINYFQCINNLFSVDNIVYFEIFDDWVINKNQTLKSKYPKWTDTVFNQDYKPMHQTEYNNLFVAGAHCKTSTNSWLMESACESAKIVSNILLKKNNKPKVFHYDHSKTNFITVLLTLFDDIIYIFLGEYVSIIDISIIILSLIILYGIYRKNSFK